jgi:hypothetical protein
LSENPNLLLKEDTFDSVSDLEELWLRNASFSNVKSIERLFSPLSRVIKINLARNILLESELRMVLGLQSLKYLILDRKDMKYPSLESCSSSGKNCSNIKLKQLNISESLPKYSKKIMFDHQPLS